jgi:type II secretory pathway component GspD/PulD (secretin)
MAASFCFPRSSSRKIVRIRRPVALVVVVLTVCPSDAQSPSPSAQVTEIDAAAQQTASPTVSYRPDELVEKELVRLEFRDQPWLAVLKWLAEVRRLNLDWQQLPDGTLNLVSTKNYSLEEAEDLINMQLLARGFTLLQRGEVLRVAPLEKIDITLVPKVSPDELATLPRHRFVRVNFPLDWMIAEEAATEFKPLVSPYGQLFPIASSNRLEAMDAVVNLRELHRLLTRAEADEGRRERVAEFRLQHRKAVEVAVKVRQLLGLPREETPDDNTQTQLDIEKTKFRSEAIKQLGAGAQQLLVDKPDVHLVVNEEENSILVNGRPDKIEIARQAIEAMDKPLPPGETPWESVNRVKIYEVSGFDPDTVSQLLQTLQQRGNLSKETRIQHEEAYNRLVVFGSPEDQVTIASIISSFRTQGRRAEVLPLARIDPAYASKAVRLVLKNPDRPASAPAVASEGQFQVEPDSAHNRLLLWATPAEVAEVRDFLVRLGETFASGTVATQLHVVQLRGASAPEVTERLKEVWNEISNVPLQIEGEGTAQPPTIAPTPSPTAAPAQDAETDRTAEPMGDRRVGRTAARLVVQQQPASATEAPQDAAPKSDHSTKSEAAASPVRVIMGEGDDMLIVSRDAAAADTAKQFVEQMVPAPQDVQVIQLKHAQATMVKTQLDTLLEHTRDADSSALNTQPPLRIDSDVRTNRLLIQHASPRQLRLINEMVPQLDQPEQEDDRLVRQQRIYHAKRKRAAEIAVVVKEVYRDLLSSSDKVFAGRDTFQPFGYSRALAATTKSPEYQGLLSVGVDEAGNTLVLSAPAYLMEEVMRLVILVDATAGGERVVVVPLKSGAARASVGEALSRMLAKPE